MDQPALDGPYELPPGSEFYYGWTKLLVRWNGRGAGSERHGPLRCTEMLCEITLEPGYLKVELFNRDTAEDTRNALAAITAEARKHRCSQILISVHASRSIFKVEQSGLLECFRGLGETSTYRIALTADSKELGLSHQYIESVARRAGINVRSFRSERAALHWFTDRRWLVDRRQRHEPWSAIERRREQRPRRASALA